MVINKYTCESLEKKIIETTRININYNSYTHNTTDNIISLLLLIHLITNTINNNIYSYFNINPSLLTHTHD